MQEWRFSVARTFDFSGKAGNSGFCGANVALGVSSLQCWLHSVRSLGPSLSLSLDWKHPGSRGHVCSVVLVPQHSQTTWHKTFRMCRGQPGSWLVLGTVDGRAQSCQFPCSPRSSPSAEVPALSFAKGTLEMNFHVENSMGLEVQGN